MCSFLPADMMKLFTNLHKTISRSILLITCLNSGKRNKLWSLEQNRYIAFKIFRGCGFCKLHFPVKYSKCLKHFAECCILLAWVAGGKSVHAFGQKMSLSKSDDELSRDHNKKLVFLVEMHSIFKHYISWNNLSERGELIKSGSKIILFVILMTFKEMNTAAKS